MATRGNGDLWTHPAILILVGIVLAVTGVMGFVNGTPETATFIVTGVGFVLLIAGLIAVGGSGGRSNRRRGSRRR